MTWTVTRMFATSAEIEAVAAARPDRSAVDEEVVWMDRVLRRYPLEMGEARYPVDHNYRPVIDRVWYGDAVGVYYRVDQHAMTVRVLTVGPSKRPRPY